MLSDIFGNFGSIHQRLMCTLEILTKFRAIRKEAGVLVILSADSHISHFISGFTFKTQHFQRSEVFRSSFITSVEHIDSVA